MAEHVKCIHDMDHVNSVGIIFLLLYVLLYEFLASD